MSGEKIRQNSTNLVAEAWDVVNKTTNLNFTINSEESGSDDDSLVSVSLPASLLQRYKKKQRITFIHFSNDKLFPQTQSADEGKKFVNSKIVSASVKVCLYNDWLIYQTDFGYLQVLTIAVISQLLISILSYTLFLAFSMNCSLI